MWQEDLGQHVLGNGGGNQFQTAWHPLRGAILFRIDTLTVTPLKIKVARCQDTMRTSIVSFFLCPSSGDGSAHDARFHLPHRLCDARVSRDAYRMARSPSPPALLVDPHTRVSPGRKTLEEMARWTPATITAWRFGRLLKAAYWNVHLLVSWLAQECLATLPPPTNGILYLFGDGSHADKHGTKNPVTQRGRISQYHPWYFGIRFVLLLAAWDGYRVPVGFRLILPKRHAGYCSENALFREMVGEFVPPRWAKRVIVGGDAAYGFKDNTRMVQDRDQADPARPWGFVFAIARTWKTVEEKSIQHLVTHLPRKYYQRTRVPKETPRKAVGLFGRITPACVCVMSVKSPWC